MNMNIEQMYKKNDFLFSFSIFLGLLISYFFKFDWMAIIFFLCYLLFIAVTNMRLLVKYFYLFFLILMNIFGVFVIEHSTEQLYLYEITQFSYSADTLAPLILAYMVFIESLNIFEIKLGNKLNKASIQYPKKIFDYTILFFVFILMLLFLRVLNKPFFLFSYDRFAYQKFILSSIEIKLGNMMLWISPIFFVGLKKYRKMSIVGIFLFFLYFVWIGNKFSVFLIGFQLGVIILIDYIDYSKFKNFSKKIIQVFLLLIAVVLIQSSLVNNRDFKENLIYFQSRLAQQGQLWWGIYKEPTNHNFHIEEAKKETEVFFKISDNVEKKNQLGMFKAMRLVAPEVAVRNKIEQGSRYAASTQGLLFYYFNFPILLICMVIISLLLVLASNLLIKYSKEYNVICFILVSKILVALIRMFSNSDFDTIFSIETAVSVLIISTIELAQRKK